MEVINLPIKRVVNGIEVEFTSEPTDEEWKEWELSCARHRKLLKELREDGIDYRDILLREDKDSLTNEEVHIAIQLMDLTIKTTYPKKTDQWKKTFMIPLDEKVKVRKIIFDENGEQREEEEII